MGSSLRFFAFSLCRFVASATSPIFAFAITFNFIDMAHYRPNLHRVLRLRAQQEQQQNTPEPKTPKVKRATKVNTSPKSNENE